MILIRKIDLKRCSMNISLIRKSFSKREDILNKVKDIPDVRTFLKNNNTKTKISHRGSNNPESESFINSLPANYEKEMSYKKPKTFFIETYGCQMNENDSEIISTILYKAGLVKVDNIEDANVILTNTCAIRESAEEKVWNNIQHYKGMKKRDPYKIFGIMGCMAERMKEKILERSNNIVDLIVGPDAYRDLPNMIDIISKKDDSQSRFAMNVQLSLEETYGDIMPVRQSSDNVKAYLSIMRGCNNMCSFCIVPFTRGRERSRDYQSILDEVRMLRDNGVKEITLLGQNVNSFIDQTYTDVDSKNQHVNSPGFRELYKLRNKTGLRFAELIDKVSDIAPEVRFRFTSPHPKEFPEHLIDVIKSKNNICKQIHLPAQSGNSKVLNDMRRYYTRDAYINLVSMIREKIPLIALSSDFIAGFCGESEEEFNDTLTLIEEINFDMAFLFAYSMREKTHAYHHLKDDVDLTQKKARLTKMIDIFRKHQLEKNKKEIGAYHIVLVEGFNRKNNSKLVGRTDTNKLCIFDNIKVLSDLPKSLSSLLIKDENEKTEISKGDYIMVKIDDCSNNTLYATPVSVIKKMSDFFNLSNNHPYIQSNI